MKLRVETGKVKFRVGKVPEPKMKWAPKGQEREQEHDETGQPLYVTQLGASDPEEGYSPLNVTTAGEPAKLTFDQEVTPTELVATPWAQVRDGRVYSGVAFRAKAIQPVKPGAQSQAAGS